MLKYIIFDFDGTLVDSLAIGISNYNEIAKKHNLKQIKQSDIKRLRKLSIMERMKELDIPIYKIPFLAIEFHKLFKSSLANLEFFPKIKEMLKKLDQAGYKIAIISSNSEDNIKEFLKAEGIDCIEDVFSSTSLFGKDKVINKFLNKHQVDASEVIYVGDEERDIISCKKIGVDVIWVSWGFDLLEVARKHEPDYIVNQPSEILEIVKQI